MSIVILDTFWRLVNIASGILSIARELRSYINGKKDSKKDPSFSLPAPDGSDEDC